MVDRGAPDPEGELDSFIAAYEAAQARDGRADLTAFLPDPGHPLYRAVLCELVRVDLEYGWVRGEPRSLEEYRRNFPQLFQDPEDLRAVTFEEYRLRRRAGEDPAAEDYRRRFGVDVRGWPAHGRPPGPGLLSDAGTDLPASALRGDGLAPDGRGGPNPWPAPGTDFLGFHLIAELGRGAFGRVYLARQGELADRPVALKVSRDVRGESRTLARLQHTNIVPVYSVHHASPFHAVCMPFLGSTTLADVLRWLRRRGGLPASGKALADAIRACDSPRPDGTPGANGKAQAAGAAEPAGGLKALEGLSHVEAVLWLGARLADGLAHAHERGVLHRDLKPANVLLTDDGTPMLLDFNLSQDTRPRAGAPAFVGGTLPYMAPEHLAAFQGRPHGVDARSDLYSLGVLLYELLAGRHPFPVREGPPEGVLPCMVQDRLRPPPALRPGNPGVSPAAEAIVRRCLEPEPGRRYQTARQLLEDLERHRNHFPLRHAREPSLRERARKWARRHPRLTSSASVALLAAVLLLGSAALLLLRGERLARLEAAESFTRFREDVRAAQVLFLEAPGAGPARLEEMAGASRQALDRYRVLEDPSWRGRPAFRRLPPEGQERLRADVGELLFLLSALTHLKAHPDAGPARDPGPLRLALDLNLRSEGCYPPDRAPAALWRQRAFLAEQLGRPEEAARLRAKAEASPPRGARDCCMLACAYDTRGRFRTALPLWRRGCAEDPRNVWAWCGLGNCYDNLGQPAQAAACYSACIALHPDFDGWYFKRGLAHLRQGQYSLACADFDQAVRRRPGRAEAHVNRALARLGAGRPEGAVRDLTRAVELGAGDARVYLMRARAREKAGDVAGAGRDRAEGQRREPADEAGWVARGVARAGSAPAAALADFDRALARNPRFLPALESKAHVLAEKLGRPAEAVRVLDRAVALYPEHAPARAARGVLLARLHKRDAALRDAREALSLDGSGATSYQAAGVYALTSRLHPGDRPRSLSLLTSALRQGYGHDLIRADPDLDPVRDDPHFQHLLRAVQTLRQESPRPASETGKARAGAGGAE